jgi:hypothetical protein
VTTEKQNPHQERADEGFYQPSITGGMTMSDSNFTRLDAEYLAVTNDLHDEFHSLIDLVRTQLSPKASILIYVSSIQSLKHQLRNMGVL